MLQELELHFTVGQALVMSAQGMSCPIRRDKWRQSESDHWSDDSVLEMSHEMSYLVDCVLDKYICHVNPHIKQVSTVLTSLCVDPHIKQVSAVLTSLCVDPHIKQVSTLLTNLCDGQEVMLTAHSGISLQAACVWLLTIVKKSAKFSAVTKRSPDIQSAFMRLLSENDGKSLCDVTSCLCLIW